MNPRGPILPVLLALLWGALAAAADQPRPVPYAPGTIRIEVDATNLNQRILRVKEIIPVRAGPLALQYPRWVPGGHSPRNPIDKMAGFIFTAGGQRLDWTRDPLDVNVFRLVVPAGVREISAEFQYLTPTDGAQGRVVVTPNMLNLQWISTILYPAGHYGSQVIFEPHVRYPAGWTAFTALDEVRREGDSVQYETVPFDILVDSPVMAGRHTRQIDLTPAGSAVPVRLGVVADAPKYLETRPEQLAQHQSMIVQALKLYGAQHYDRYQFLFALSDQLGGIGLEHQRSSENGVGADYFTAWDDKVGFTDLLAHEYTHSWNGKYRRPADLWTPNLNVPMQDSLLWVYEGQTQYWGNVLAARSGLRPMQAARDALALVFATYTDNRPGLSWRNVQDTTNDPIIANRAVKAFPNYQLSEDYYRAGQLIWFEVDTLIRSRSAGRKSLDDFARAFFGIRDGEWKVQRTYTFADVVATLNGVVATDWGRFLRERLDGKVPITGGLEASGWRLVYRDEPNAYAKAQAKGKRPSTPDYLYSLGFTVAKDGKIAEVRWDSPAFNAGLALGTQIAAVNDIEFSTDVLDDALKAAATDKTQPIRLLVRDLARYRVVSLDYHAGARFPHLERIEGVPDLLTAIFTPRP